VLTTRELFPDPDTPVNTVNRRLGISTLTSLRLFSRAPETRIRSWPPATRIESTLPAPSVSFTERCSNRPHDRDRLRQHRSGGRRPRGRRHRYRPEDALTCIRPLHRRRRSPAPVVRAPTLEELLIASDVVSVHVAMNSTSARTFRRPGVRHGEAGRGVRHRGARRPRRPRCPAGGAGPRPPLRRTKPVCECSNPSVEQAIMVIEGSRPPHIANPPAGRA